MMQENSAPQQRIGGLDEVGWGALAGPVISVVAVFRPSDLALLPAGVKDSKKTNERQREMLYLPLCRCALDVGIGHAWPWEIDQYGPYPALQLSYRRALEDLAVAKPDLLIVDGSHRVEGWKGRQQVEPKADVNHQQVSAASIIAKYFRDTIMADYAKQMRAARLPDYNWAENKGYGTADHMEAIKRYGLLISPNNRPMYLHRQRYCQKLMAKRA